MDIKDSDKLGFRRETGRFHLPGPKMLLVAAFCLLLAFGTRAADFKATLDRDTITLGESATLSLTFEGAQPENVQPPGVQGLQITSTGYSFNNVVNNGQASSTMTATFTVTPQQTGEFVIPGMQANIGGQVFRTQPIKLTVEKPSAPSSEQINSGSQIAFMQMKVPQEKVYPGEVLAGQLEIFLRDDVQRSGDFQIVNEPADGLAIGKILNGQQQQQIQIGGHNFRVVPLPIELTATRSGTLSVGPISADMVILTGAEQGFFGLMGGEQQRITLTTDKITIESLPLPTQNVPASFNGAVGDYNWTVTSGPTNVAVGDPITLHVQISGRGAIDSLRLPDQAGWNDFKLFTPTSKTQLSDDLGNEGTKTFEQIVAPENANIHELPALAFTFFNPEDGNYHTLTQSSTPLFVTATSATPLPTIAAAKQPESPAPQDIVPIRQNLGALAQASTPLIIRPSFLALQSVPILAFFAALVWRKRVDNLANNPRLRRRRAVAQLIASGLNDLNKFAAENKSNEFFAVLFRLLQELLGERLDCPAISITEADADARLDSLGAKPETVNSLRELFQICNQARYAPIQTSQELSAVAAKFEKTAGELQDLKA